MRSHSFLLSIGLVCAAAASGAAQPAPLRLTLDDALARAREASHRLAELAAREEGSRAAVRSREAADRPRVSLLGGYQRTNHVEEFAVRAAGGPVTVVYPDIPDNFRSRLDVEWPLFTFGRSGALRRAAEADADAAARDVSAGAVDLRLEVARAYWDLVTAHAAVAVVREALDRAETHVSDMRARLDQGFVPPNELQSAQAQRSRQRLLLVEAETDRDDVAAELRRLTGIAPDTPIEPAATLDPPDPVPADTAQLVEMALGSRSDRAGLERRVTAASERLQAALAEQRPAIAAAGGFDYARPNPRIFPRSTEWQTSWDVGLNLTWSLWDGGRTDAQAAEARAGLEAARQRLADLDAAIELEVRQRRLELDARQSAIAAAEDALTNAAEARRVVAERFAVGVATSADVLDAQVALLQAGLDRTRALASARLAEARLARAVGR
jgi:outer membrane protein TolC